MVRRPPSLLPLCACGCRQRVKSRDCRFASPQCVPRSLRADNCRRGRRTFAYRRRALAFRDDLARLTAGGRRITREDLLVAFHRVYRRGYNSGFRVAQRGGSLSDAQERGAA